MSDEEDLLKQLEAELEIGEAQVEKQEKIVKETKRPNVQLVPNKPLFIDKPTEEEKRTGRVAHGVNVVNYPLPPELIGTDKRAPSTAVSLFFKLDKPVNDLDIKQGNAAFPPIVLAKVDENEKVNI